MIQARATSSIGIRVLEDENTMEEILKKWQDSFLDVMKDVGLKNGSGPLIYKDQWNFRTLKPKSWILSEREKSSWPQIVIRLASDFIL